MKWPTTGIAFLLLGATIVATAGKAQTSDPRFKRVSKVYVSGSSRDDDMGAAARVLQAGLMRNESCLELSPAPKDADAELSLQVTLNAEIETSQSSHWNWFATAVLATPAKAGQPMGDVLWNKVLKFNTDRKDSGATEAARLVLTELSQAVGCKERPQSRRPYQMPEPPELFAAAIQSRTESFGEQGYANCGLSKEVGVYSSPGYPYKLVANLKCGEELAVLGREGDQVKVRTKNNELGYVWPWFVSKAPPRPKAEVASVAQSQEAKAEPRQEEEAAPAKPPKKTEAEKRAQVSTQQSAEPVLNWAPKSPKQKYPLHAQVLRSDVQFVTDSTATAFTSCWMLFSTPVCSATVSGPTVTQGASMRVLIEESGEETDIRCDGNSYTYCTALPVGRYAARFMNQGMRHNRFLVVPVLPLEGKNKDKEVAAWYYKDVHHPTFVLPGFDSPKR